MVSIKPCFFVLLLLTTACSTTTEVQLFTQYLSGEEQDSITKLLQQNDFQVVPNSVEVPDGLHQTSLIYSPLNNNIDQVNRLIDILADSSFGMPALELTGKENHYYGRRTVGLYIVPTEHLKTKTISSVYATEYNGRCLTVDANLRLNNDGTASLISYFWDESSNRDLSAQSNGQWYYQDHKIYLSIDDNEPSQFEVTRREQRGKNGFVEIRLKNNNLVPFYDRCDFIYRALTN